MLELSVLASGSSGNCFFIGSDKGNILVDAGISCKQIETRLEQIGKSISNISAVFITHEHIDHIRAVDVISRKYNLPIYMNRKTLANSQVNIPEINVFHNDEEIDINGLKVLPFSKNHDSDDPVSFLVKNNKKTASILTDIGFCCENVRQAVSESDLLVMEANHDTWMLKNGPYPEYLKKRISGGKGHLSNYSSALAVLEHSNKKLQHLLLAHLSLNNNTPKLALKTFDAILKERSDLKNLKTWLTYREKPTDLIRV